MSKPETKGKLGIKTVQVGPWGLNAYALVCSETRQSALIDPGADPEALQELLAESDPMAIILTHTHSDHMGALTDMRKRLQAPLMAHPGSFAGNAYLDAEKWLSHGDIIHIGNHRVKVYHTPGHCEDQISLLSARHHCAIVGDTIFEGGPGKTWSEQDFRITLQTLRNVVLSWPDETVCYPGHGNSFRLGDIRRAIEAFIGKDHGGFFGDATWDM
jgi:glyoxylase-like metal-dependent hydrolase (beta-lactamase superfamily II)